MGDFKGEGDLPLLKFISYRSILTCHKKRVKIHTDFDPKHTDVQNGDRPQIAHFVFR